MVIVPQQLLTRSPAVVRSRFHTVPDELFNAILQVLINNERSKFKKNKIINHIQCISGEHKREHQRVIQIT